MSVSEWIKWLGALAAIIAIVSAGYRFICWSKNRFKAKPFGKTVSSNFTYQDVRAGVNKLVEYSFHFGPEVIIGINRGGAIVGGLIGKHLGIVPQIIEVDPKPSSGKTSSEKTSSGKMWFCNIDELCGRKVLLVDDRLADGNHMMAAYNYLQPIVGDIRRVVFTWIRDNRRQQIGNGPDEYAYEANSKQRLLPWEPKEGAKAINFARRSNSIEIPPLS